MRNFRARSSAGFTLVELLVVIGIIALLIGILLPTLNKAREAGNTIKCAANLRSIGQGMAVYIAENRQTYPAAYMYVGQVVTPTTQSPNHPVQYVHWSSYLYKKGLVGRTDAEIFGSTVGWDAFQCPSLDKGGLPPTNPAPGNLDGGQNSEVPGKVDYQAPRIAYTVNEAICPRNKWVVGFDGAIHTYQFVRAAQVKRSAETILATEFNPDWRVVSEDNGSGIVKSHRPVHGFKGDGNILDLQQVPLGTSFGRVIKTIHRVTAADLTPDIRPNQESRSRLDWVGRNHGRWQGSDHTNGKNSPKTNFLYVDGHVETKTIEETLTPFQWGQTMYSLSPNGDVE